VKIGIDATLFSRGRYTGIENVALNLIREILQLDKVNEYVFFFRKEVPEEVRVRAKIKIHNDAIFRHNHW